MSVMVEWRNRLIQVYNGIKKSVGIFPTGIGVIPIPIYVHSHSFPIPVLKLGVLFSIPWDSREIQSRNTSPMVISATHREAA